MRKNSIKYINTDHGRRVDLRAVNTQIVQGNFPKYSYRKSPLERLNKFLGLVLLIFVMLALVSYYFVSDDEKKMNKLGRDIVDLTNENIELQNRLDNLHSFNRVDDFIKSNSTLNTAKKIIEIPAVNVITEPKVEPINVSYNWSVGY